MKRGKILVLVLIILIFSYVLNSYTEDLSYFIGKATGVQTSLTINVDADPPDLFIINPENTTYDTNISIPLNYSVSDKVSDVGTVWYNLDNGVNITLTENTTFDTNRDDHILYLFANDSKNHVNNSESVSFSVSIISYQNYSGSTTDFSCMCNEDLQNISNLTLENTNFGKIIFNDNINISEYMDLDTYITIADNTIILDSGALSNLNKPATLTLYNLNFTNPRVLKDNEVCHSSICTNIAYLNNILTFDVSGFTTYSAEETPSTVPTGQAVSGGGGGGGGKVDIPKFSIDQTLIKVLLTLGERFEKSLKIKNDGKESVSINVEVDDNLKKVVKVSEQSFSIPVGSTKEISLDFNSIGQSPSVVVGKLFLKSGSIQKAINAVIEFESKFVLFDIALDIPLKYSEIYSGESLLLAVSLFNIGNVGTQQDVEIKYIIKDMENNIIIEETDDVAVETQASFTKQITIPPYIGEGDYVAVVQAKYDDSTGVASEVFKIRQGEEKQIIKSIRNLYLFGFVLLLIVIFLSAFFTIHYKKLKFLSSVKKENLVKKYNQKLKYSSVQENETLREKLMKKLSLLESGFREHHISSNVYLEGKETIEKLIKDIDKKNVKEK